MDKQWSLYSVSSLILLILLKLTIDQGHIILACLLGMLLLIQVTGTIICVHQKTAGSSLFTHKK